MKDKRPVPEKTRWKHNITGEVVTVLMCVKVYDHYECELKRDKVMAKQKSVFWKTTHVLREEYTPTN